MDSHGGFDLCFLGSFGFFVFLFFIFGMVGCHCHTTSCHATESSQPMTDLDSLGMRQIDSRAVVLCDPQWPSHSTMRTHGFRFSRLTNQAKNKANWTFFRVALTLLLHRPSIIVETTIAPSNNQSESRCASRSQTQTYRHQQHQHKRNIGSNQVISFSNAHSSNTSSRTSNPSPIAKNHTTSTG